MQSPATLIIRNPFSFPLLIYQKYCRYETLRVKEQEIAEIAGLFKLTFATMKIYGIYPVLHKRNKDIFVY